MKESFKTTDTKIDRILSVILVIAIVLAISTTVYVIVTPKEGEKFTEFIGVRIRDCDSNYRYLLYIEYKSDYFTR
jgi:uncharacterized membrane protein